MSNVARYEGREEREGRAWENDGRNGPDVAWSRASSESHDSDFPAPFLGSLSM